MPGPSLSDPSADSPSSDPHFATGRPKRWLEARPNETYKKTKGDVNPRLYHDETVESRNQRSSEAALEDLSREYKNHFGARS